MHNGFAIALAWPDTLCKQAGAWYDFLLYYLGINRLGYYKVGHAALVLIDDESGNCRYFDFGRYHAPAGHGRVRSKETDFDLKIRTRAIVSSDCKNICNLKEILTELYENPSTHGTGMIFGAATRINHIEVEKFIFQLQEKEHVPYGPFIQNGTNCSRFVNSAILAGNPLFSQRIKLQLAPMLTPTPMWNLKAVGGNIMSAYQSDIYKTQKILTQKLQIIAAS
jgi:hypothetical protein